MKPHPLLYLAALFALVSVPVHAASLKWIGLRSPAKVSAGDGVTKLGEKIGTFVTLRTEDEWPSAIAQVTTRFPTGARRWITHGVGEVPGGPTLSIEEHEKFLKKMEMLGVDVYLELWPRKTTNVPAAIDEWLGKLKHHPAVKGMGIDLEFAKGPASDEDAKIWDEKIKSHGAGYRMFLKHWEQRFMPPTYRGKGDIIFINTSSEASVEALNKEYVEWAAHFAPSACAFQIGYPADEDGMDGSKEKGWWKLQDPIKDWATSLVAQIKQPQDIGIIWICVKSGKSYNQSWDLTRLPSGPRAK